jgi:metal-responsive CopG/Arc/MetJ family transcriptional regulator
VKRVRRKIAISVSAELLAAADALARETGESRSAVYERALRGYLVALQGRERSLRYVEGYRRIPETAREIAATLRAGLPALTAEPWDEAR